MFDYAYYYIPRGLHRATPTRALPWAMLLRPVGAGGSDFISSPLTFHVSRFTALLTFHLSLLTFHGSFTFHLSQLFYVFIPDVAILSIK